MTISNKWNSNLPKVLWLLYLLVILTCQGCDSDSFLKKYRFSINKEGQMNLKTNEWEFFCQIYNEDSRLVQSYKIKDFFNYEYQGPCPLNNFNVNPTNFCGLTECIHADTNFLEKIAYSSDIENLNQFIESEICDELNQLSNEDMKEVIKSLLLETQVYTNDGRAKFIFKSDNLLWSQVESRYKYTLSRDHVGDILHVDGKKFLINKSTACLLKSHLSTLRDIETQYNGENSFVLCVMSEGLGYQYVEPKHSLEGVSKLYNFKYSYFDLFYVFTWSLNKNGCLSLEKRLLNPAVFNENITLKF